MATRVMDGPEKDWLDDGEVAAILGVSVKTLKRMIAEDGFPAGHTIREQTVRWPWDDLVFWRLWLERKGRIAVPEIGILPAPEKKTEDNRGQPRTTGAK